MKVKLDGKEILNRDILHKTLKEKFNLPEYYGENLDSFWDILSCKGEHVEIVLINIEYLNKNLGVYGEKFINLLKDLEEENSNIKYTEG